MRNKFLRILLLTLAIQFIISQLNTPLPSDSKLLNNTNTTRTDRPDDMMTPDLNQGLNRTGVNATPPVNEPMMTPDLNRGLNRTRVNATPPINEPMMTPALNPGINVSLLNRTSEADNVVRPSNLTTPQNASSIPSGTPTNTSTTSPPTRTPTNTSSLNDSQRNMTNPSA
jgi:hypothetical protein